MSLSFTTRSAKRGLGDFDPWSCMWCHVWSADDVYVLRLRMDGVTILNARDALRFVQSAGQAQNFRLDVRGMAIRESGTGILADIVFTAREGFVGIPILADTATSMAATMNADPDLLQVYPDLKISLPVFGRLTGPPDALDQWKSVALLWDNLLSGPRGRGGPTDTFATPGDYNLVRGSAEDGKRANPFSTGIAQPPLGPGKVQPAPVPQPPGKQNGSQVSGSAILFGLGAFTAVAMGFYWSTQKGNRRQ